MSKRQFIIQQFILVYFVLFAFLPLSAIAAGGNKASEFLFGNHIDSHQFSKLVGNGDLHGKLMITYTGDYAENGLPIAKHCNDETEAKDCVAGWKFVGKPGMATFLYHKMDHPVWLVENRAEIPQPGAFTHFHWVAESHTSSSHDTMPMGCNAHSAMQLTEGEACHGYFLELYAIKSFVFKHHMDLMPVTAGIDTSTHTNIVTSVPSSHDDGGDQDGSDHEH